MKSSWKSNDTSNLAAAAHRPTDGHCVTARLFLFALATGPLPSDNHSQSRPALHITSRPLPSRSFHALLVVTAPGLPLLGERPVAQVVRPSDDEEARDDVARRDWCGFIGCSVGR